jgi:hypothetical protein
VAGSRSCPPRLRSEVDAPKMTNKS